MTLKRRRRVLEMLATTGGLALAGCSEGGDSGATENDSGNGDTDTGGTGGDTTDTSGTSGDTTDDGSGDSGGDEEGGDSATADIVVVESEMRTRDEEDVLESHVEFVAENRGDARSGEVEVEVSFLDSDGNELTIGQETVRTLDAGATWNGWATARDDGNPEEFDSFEVNTEVEPTIDVLPNLTVTDTRTEIETPGYNDSTREVTLIGNVENTGDTSYDTINALANLLDSQGRVMEDGDDDITNIDPGETPSFQIEFDIERNRTSEGTDYDIVFIDL